MSLSTPPTATLAPVPDPPARHPAYGHHQHGPTCWWDHRVAGWHCATAATAAQDPDVVLDPGCPDVA